MRVAFRFDGNQSTVYGGFRSVGSIVKTTCTLSRPTGAPLGATCSVTPQAGDPVALVAPGHSPGCPAFAPCSTTTTPWYGISSSRGGRRPSAEGGTAPSECLRQGADQARLPADLPLASGRDGVLDCTKGARHEELSATQSPPPIRWSGVSMSTSAMHHGRASVTPNLAVALTVKSRLSADPMMESIRRSGPRGPHRNRAADLAFASEFAVPANSLRQNTPHSANAFRSVVSGIDTAKVDASSFGKISAASTAGPYTS
jgi:hypothetical protein